MIRMNVHKFSDDSCGVPVRKAIQTHYKSPRVTGSVVGPLLLPQVDDLATGLSLPHFVATDVVRVLGARDRTEMASDLV